MAGPSRFGGLSGPVFSALRTELFFSDYSSATSATAVAKSADAEGFRGVTLHVTTEQEREIRIRGP